MLSISEGLSSTGDAQLRSKETRSGKVMGPRRERRAFI